MYDASQNTGTQVEQRRLSSIASDFRYATGEQIIQIERLVAEVASIRVADMTFVRHRGGV